MSTKNKFLIPALSAILAGGQAAIDSVMAPLRARKARAKAETLLVSIDEQLITLEREIVELCTKEDVDFTRVLDKMNDYEWAVRRKEQLTAVVEQLFAAKAEVKKD